MRQNCEGQTGRKRIVKNKALPKCLGEPEWLSEEDIRHRIIKMKGDIFVIADREEHEAIYSLAAKRTEKASLKISKIKPENIIKTALIKKDADIAPLYLKPARYELMGK